MAYNPALYGNYGMYGNPYGQFPQQTTQQASYTPVQPTQGMVWVDGETEAKGKQIPAGATQFAMWDINEPVIYIKSLNQMGIPNPLRKIHYKMEEQSPTQTGTSNLMSGEEEKDGTAYVKRDELQTMKDEIMQAIREMKPDSASSARRTTAKGEQ